MRNTLDDLNREVTRMNSGVDVGAISKIVGTGIMGVGSFFYNLIRNPITAFIQIIITILIVSAVVFVIYKVFIICLKKRLDSKKVDVIEMEPINIPSEEEKPLRLDRMITYSEPTTYPDLHTNPTAPILKAVPHEKLVQIHEPTPVVENSKLKRTNSMSKYNIVKKSSLYK